MRSIFGWDAMVDDLTRYLAPPGAGAGFAATRTGGLAIIEPLTAPAEQWLRANASAESSWRDGSLIVEMRYFSTLADAIIDAGFLFERDALPN